MLDYFVNMYIITTTNNKHILLHHANFIVLVCYYHVPFVSSILRDRGYFGDVTVFWQLFTNNTPLQPGMEFVNTSGSVEFTTGDVIKPIVLEAISDKLPEFNEYYVLLLVNISGKVTC